MHKRTLTCWEAIGAWRVKVSDARGSGTQLNEVFEDGLRQSAMMAGAAGYFGDPEMMSRGNDQITSHVEVVHKLGLQVNWPALSEFINNGRSIARIIDVVEEGQ